MWYHPEWKTIANYELLIKQIERNNSKKLNKSLVAVYDINLNSLNIVVLNNSNTFSFISSLGDDSSTS